MSSTNRFMHKMYVTTEIYAIYGTFDIPTAHEMYILCDIITGLI